MNPWLLGGSALLGGALGAQSPEQKLTPAQKMSTYLQYQLMNKTPEFAGMQNITKDALNQVDGYTIDVEPSEIYVEDVLGGNRLNGNPHLDDMFDRASGKVRSKIDSQFVKAGRYGSGAHANVMSDAYNDLASDVYHDNYKQERQLQHQAATLLPGLQSMYLNNVKGLLDVGAVEDDWAQTENSWGFNTALQKLGAMGMGAPSPQPLSHNKTAGALGGALSGVMLANGIGGLMGGGGAAAGGDMAGWDGAL